MVWVTDTHTELLLHHKYDLGNQKAYAFVHIIMYIKEHTFMIMFMISNLNSQGSQEVFAMSLLSVCESQLFKLSER